MKTIIITIAIFAVIIAIIQFNPPTPPLAIDSAGKSPVDYAVMEGK